MYFIHPQIQLKNALKAKLSLLKSVDSDKLSQKLSSYFPDKQFVFTDMARSAFKAIIEQLHLQNSEMLLPAYICDIFYPILKAYNIKPVFLDINLETFHVSLEEIKKKMTPGARSILVCHTYGLPVDIQAVRNAVSGRLIVIEDCAHSFFAKKDGVYAGNMGDVSFFSLYKQFPSLRGGMLVCPKNWNIGLPETSFNFRDFISFLNYFWPFAFLFKMLGSQKIGSEEIARKLPRTEKKQTPAGINRASLSLFADFFDNIRDALPERQRLALLLQDELKKMGFTVQESSNNVFCYLSTLVPEALADQRDKIVRELHKHMIFCTRIWHAPIILNEDVRKDYQINPADFPNTLKAFQRIINFPLQHYYKEKDIKKMIGVVKNLVSRL